MRGPRPAPCIFPKVFLQEALATVGRRTASVQEVQRFRLVLLLHERPSLSHEDTAEVVGLSARQVQRWRRRWVAGDFTIDDHPGRGRKPDFSPAGSRVGASHGLRNRRRDQIATQSAVGCRSDEPGQEDAGQGDQQQHGLADAARGCYQALAVRALDFSA